MFDAVVWNNPWVRAVCTVIALILTGVTLYLLNFVLVPLFIAFIVAYIFNPIIKRVEAHKVSRMAAIIGVLALILLIFVSVPLLIIPSMINEAKDFARPTRPVQAPSSENAEQSGDAQVLLDEEGQEVLQPHVYADLGPFESSVMEPIVEVMEWTPLEHETKPSMVVRRKIGESIEGPSQAILEMIRSNVGPLFGLGRSGVETVAGAVLTVWGQVLNLCLFLGNVVLFTFVTVYLLRDYNAVITAARGLIPERFRPFLGRILGDIDRQLKAFFRGQLMVCACLGTFYCIGLSVAGTPFALPLGIFGGLVSFVPFLGIALTIGPAVLLTLLAYGLDWHIFFVLFTFVIAQMVEGNFLTPKIVGSQVGLSPVWVILSVMTFGTTLGFKGLLVAVPLAATLKVLVLEAVKYYKTTSFFTGPSADDPS